MAVCGIISLLEFIDHRILCHILFDARRDRCLAGFEIACSGILHLQLLSDIGSGRCITALYTLTRDPCCDLCVVSSIALSIPFPCPITIVSCWDIACLIIGCDQFFPRRIDTVDTHITMDLCLLCLHTQL